MLCVLMCVHVCACVMTHCSPRSHADTVAMQNILPVDAVSLLCWGCLLLRFPTRSVPPEARACPGLLLDKSSGPLRAVLSVALSFDSSVQFSGVSQWDVTHDPGFYSDCSCFMSFMLHIRTVEQALMFSNLPMIFSWDGGVVALITFFNPADPSHLSVQYFLAGMLCPCFAWTPMNTDRTVLSEGKRSRSKAACFFIFFFESFALLEADSEIKMFDRAQMADTNWQRWTRFEAGEICGVIKGNLWRTLGYQSTFYGTHQPFLHLAPGPGMHT